MNEIIDEFITREKIEKASLNLQSTANERAIYNTQKDVSNIKSAMKKYLKFISSKK
ncbi:MAG: hypothetical protein IIC74_05445 [Bacteroidetes bacterium]|nr:hypothetical protein [Bacteroidota bacterium]